ncbi:hypothetical protein EDD17DRAFT_1751796 [Pisolithus thermaeus]|nr:hypothetical protein EDD17DRAFT_1751796 [Pisolithus thermaeus]
MPHGLSGFGRFDVRFLTAGSTPTLERLRLFLAYNPAPITLLPTLERLTTLTLSGKIAHWQLEPLSIRLPFLRSLTIDVDDPSMLLEAIVAPEVSRFGFSFGESALIFGGVPPVFNKAFPNVRHLEIESMALDFFYDLGERADLWGDIECVTFHTLYVECLGRVVSTLQKWVRQREPTAKPLHVHFTRFKRGIYDNSTGQLLSMLYDSLHKDCTFEIDRFPLAERTRVRSFARKLQMNLQHFPPSDVDMYLRQDVPWRESTGGSQHVSDDESSYYADDKDP